MVSAGRLHACGVTLQGAAYCWGSNTRGQLGDGTTEDRAAPVRVVSGVPFEAVSAGFGHSCGVTRSDVAFCWGGNSNGELGDGTEENRTVPVPVSGGHFFQAITTGEAHTCAVTTTGLGYCWGAAIGLAPDGTRLPNATAPARLPLEPLLALSAGYEIACAVTRAGVTYCWGLRPPGVPFNEDTVSWATPQLVAGAPTLVTVSAGHKHACGLGEDGRTYCWGRNTSGQLGDGTFESRSEPRPVMGDVFPDGVSAHGPTHTCGLRQRGVAYCWGRNLLGELGDGTTVASTVPVPVTGGHAFVSVNVGFNYTCGVTTAGTAYCWGYGRLGQLGTGTLEDSAEPVAVAPPGGSSPDG
jgi:alpha-tubulin suppressor-like RCC1 family protein